MTASTPQQPARPDVDVMAVLAALQDQLDDLAATVAAQQTTIDRLTATQAQQRRGDG